MKQTKVEGESRARRPYEFQLENEMSNLKADFLLEEVEGQLSLKMVYWFLITHGDVVEDAITGKMDSVSGKDSVANGLKNKATGSSQDSQVNQKIQTSGGATNKQQKSAKQGGDSKGDGQSKVLKIAPRIRTSLKNVNFIHDFHYVNRYRTFDEVKTIIILNKILQLIIQMTVKLKCVAL